MVWPSADTHRYTDALSPLTHSRTPAHIYCPFVSFDVPQLCTVTQPISCCCHRTFSHKSSTHMFPLTHVTETHTSIQLWQVTYIILQKWNELCGGFTNSKCWFAYDLYKIIRFELVLSKWECKERSIFLNTQI